MRVNITREAEADLERIGEFIAYDSPRRAVSFLDELLSTCEKLSLSPRAFPFLTGFESTGLRRRPYGNYIILYRITGEAIDIIHIVHGARDYRAMLMDDE